MADNKEQSPQELLDKACNFVERMVDKKLAEDAASHREAARHQGRNTWAGIWLVVVTLGVGAAGLIYKAYAENVDRDAQTMREATRRKLEIVSSISDAISEIRELQEIAMTYCGMERTTKQKQNLEVERIKGRFALVRAARPMLHYFGEEFRTLIINFVEWDESIADYCDPSAPEEQQWRDKQREIEDQMILSPVEIFVDN